MLKNILTIIFFRTSSNNNTSFTFIIGIDKRHFHLTFNIIGFIFYKGDLIKMTYSKEQVINGLYKFIDNEIISKCDVIHKWLTKTAIDMAIKKVDPIYDELCNSKFILSLGIIDNEGKMDVNELLDILKKNAELYGDANINIPIVGYLTVSSLDVEKLKNYIMNS